MNAPLRVATAELVFKEGISPAGDDPLEYVMSDETEDSYGDVIASGGWVLTDFRKYAPALFNHDRNALIGSWTNVRVADGSLIGRLKLARAGTSLLVDYVRELVDQKIARAVSVGFKPLQYEPLGNGKSGVRYTRQVLKECSLVSVPANPNALQIARSFGLTPDDTARIHGKLAPVERRTFVAISAGKLARPLAPARTSMSTTKLGKRIQDAQAEITRLRDQLTVLSEKADDERTDEEAVQFEELPNQIDAARKRLTTLENAERAMASTVAEEQEQPEQQRQAQPQRPFAVPKKKVAPADFLVRAAACIAVARLQQVPLEQAFAKLYGSDEATGIVLRAAVNPATTTAPGWAAELVETVIGDFLDTLKPVSIYPKVAALGARFTFGRAGFIKVPTRANTPTLAGSWVGEGAPKPVRRLGLSSITLSPHKLAVISFFTEEIAEHSTPAIEGIIRDAMRDDTAESIDGYLLDNVAASATRPAGLLNGLVSLTPSAESDPLAMVADLKALAMAIIANKGGRSLVFLVNPVQAISIGLQQSTTGDFLFNSPDEAFGKLGATFISSNSVPADTVVALDAADFASATGDVPRFSISDQATIHAEDTNPLAIGTPGTPATVAAPVRSLWQEDLIGIRMHWPLTWAMRRTGMVAFIEGVTW